MDILGIFRSKRVETVQPTAVDYVEWLVRHILSGSTLELTLDTRQPLPGSGQTPGREGPPPCQPDAGAVINRLKILAGVSPVLQASNATGTFERARTNHMITVSATFNDCGAYSTCTLRLRVRHRPLSTSA